VVPVTSTLVNAPLLRLAVEPSAHNGLRALSQVVVDKLTSVRRERIGAVIGALEPDTLIRVNRALALWLDAQRAVDLWDAAQAIKTEVQRIKPLRVA